MSDDVLDRIVAFLREIGLEVVTGPIEGETFLPGVRVDAGRMLVDPAAVAWPGDLLHEAGHLALVPAERRPATTGEVDVPGVPMGQVEPAAMLWSYAAALHLGIDPALVFHGGGYRGRGPDLLRTFSLGVYPGMPVLAGAGLADRDFPRMRRWLAP